MKKLTILILLLSLSLFAGNYRDVSSRQANDALRLLNGVTNKFLQVRDSNGAVITTFDSSHVKLDSINEQIVVTQGDDYGVEFQNQVSVLGELIAGSDSYSVPIAWHCDEANTVGKTITGCTDITTIMRSDNGSYIGMFGGTTTGKYILVGSPETYEGAKVKYESTALVEPDNIQASFYESDALGWSISPLMATNANYPHEAHGDSIAVHNHESEQIFFGFNPLTRGEADTWEQTTFNINGVDYTYKFARLSVIAPITGDPLVEQIKLHTDRIEIENTGLFRYGTARTPIDLTYSIVKNDIADPSSQKVEYTPQFVADYDDNNLQGGRLDGFGVVILRTFGLDTSIPLVISMSYYPSTANTGIVEFILETSQVLDGYVYDGSEPYTTNVVYDTILSPSQYIRRSKNFVVPINKLESASGIVVNFSRDATAGNTPDTYDGNIIRTALKPYGYKWKD